MNYTNRHSWLGKTGSRRIFMAVGCVLIVFISIWGTFQWVQRQFALSRVSEREKEKREIQADIAAIRNGEAHSISWYRTSNTDSYLKEVASLDGLKDFGVDRADITDQGIEILSHALNLENVALEGCGFITDRSLDRLARFPKLRKLTLASVPITDSGLAYLENNHHLVELELAYVPLTPDAFQHLAKLKQLQALDVRGTWVSRDALEKLHVALPNTIIVGYDDNPGEGTMIRIEPKER